MNGRMHQIKMIKFSNSKLLWQKDIEIEENLR